MDGLVLKEIALTKERTTIGRKPHNDIQIDNLAVSGEHAVIVTILNDSFLEDLGSTNGTLVNGQPIKKHFLQSNDVVELGKYKLKYISDQMGKSAAPQDFEKTMVLRPGAVPKADAPKPSTSQAVPTMGTSQPAPSMSASQGMPSMGTSQPTRPPTTLSASQPVRPVSASQAMPSMGTSQPMSASQPIAAGGKVAAIQILSGANAGKEMELTKALTTLGKPGVQVAVITKRPQGYFITHVEGANFPILNGKLLDAQAHPLGDHDIIACSISDVSAMGCQPTFAVISVCFPDHTPEKFARELYKGIWSIADKYAIEIVGGDIISGRSPLCINVALLGRDDGLKPIRRSGARAGDAILVTGTLGGSILGRHLSFEPRLKEALVLNQNFAIHAMIDISDGLTADLNHILEESGVGAILYEGQIPVSRAAVELSKKTGHTPLYHALSDGEDYELLMTLSRTQAKKVLSSGLLTDVTVRCIGEIVKGHSIQMKSSGGNSRRIKPRGYAHLKS